MELDLIQKLGLENLEFFKTIPKELSHKFLNVKPGTKVLSKRKN
jgi:hypothetical protein